MFCCQDKPKKKTKKKRVPHCGDVDSRAMHLNLLRVEGKVEYTDGKRVTVYHF